MVWGSLVLGAALAGSQSAQSVRWTTYPLEDGYRIAIPTDVEVRPYDAAESLEVDNPAKIFATALAGLDGLKRRIPANKIMFGQSEEGYSLVYCTGKFPQPVWYSAQNVERLMEGTLVDIARSDQFVVGSQDCGGASVAYWSATLPDSKNLSPNPHALTWYAPIAVEPVDIAAYGCVWITQDRYFVVSLSAPIDGRSSFRDRFWHIASSIRRMDAAIPFTDGT